MSRSIVAVALLSLACSDDAGSDQASGGDWASMGQGGAAGSEDECSPGAEEVCDGKDNDCDGQVDEDFELTTDPQNCGNCGNACDYGPHTIASCSDEACKFGGCEMGFADCNGDLSDGCELDLSAGASCACAPGETRPCYTAEPSTLGVGPCQQGTQTCLPSGRSWSATCEGEVTPVLEICGNDINDDCMGGVDDGLDEDGDGWSICNGDCCDAVDQGCTDPKQVNPGAFDAVDPEGMIPPFDDDCDGTADNPAATSCSSAVQVADVTAEDLAEAMDICQTTTEASGKWGLISAELLRADGTGSPENVQVGVLNGFGSNVDPRRHATLAALSSGTARDQDGDDDDAGWVSPGSPSHVDATNEVSAPAEYLSANGGKLQSAASCPSGDTTVNDSVQLRLKLRVPTNAQGLRFNSKFYSSEYPNWVCTLYNDFFLAMLDSGAEGIPADRNIAFDAMGNPISVNNGFFEVCSDCTLGTSELVDTGYPTEKAGGTAWLATSAPVLPGEIIELQFHIWDTSDHTLDSLVLLDDFRWQLTPTSVDTIQD